MGNDNERRPDDKMTIKRITEEYGIGEGTVGRMFQDEELPVQTYTYPYFVIRSELLKYFTKRHDYLGQKA